MSDELFKINRFVFVDIETTGTSPGVDKITEIGLIVYENGKIVESFSTLLNPERSIPYFITQMCGISDYMVKDSPKFYEIAKDLLKYLKGAVFVAHNVQFDYGFIKEEFRQLGYEFNKPRLCTVKLSRHLYPEHSRHGLDHLIERLGIEMKARHRAYEDCEVLVKFYEDAHNKFSAKEIEEAIFRLIKY